MQDRELIERAQQAVKDFASQPPAAQHAWLMRNNQLYADRRKGMEDRELLELAARAAGVAV